MNRYESIMVAALRARQLGNGAVPRIASENTNPAALALQELKAGALNPLERSTEERCNCPLCIDARQRTSDPTLVTYREGSELVTADGHYEVCFCGGEGLTASRGGSSLNLWATEESWDLDAEERTENLQRRASQGGVARASKLTADQRSAIARKAGQASQERRRADKERDARIKKEVAWLFQEAQRGR